jgi:2-(1,2-epoxy-1,2-dihydrophenyl)acetyl-CoA isomerase
MAEIEVASDAGVFSVTLNRPETHNALTPSMLSALERALADAREAGARVLVLRGAGRGFSSGQQLDSLGTSGDVAERLMSAYAPVIRALRALPCPAVAAVDGACVGAGLALALACDVRIAAEGATFVPGYTGLGLVPDAGVTYFAQRLLGASRAFEWLTTNRWLPAAEAREWGLVSDVVARDDLPRATERLAAAYAAAPTTAVVLTRRLLDEAATATLEEQLAREAQSQSEAMRTADFFEALAARREERAARFTGS